MGNKLSFFLSHGKRLKNRYNAQFRALEFIGKEKLPSAPRHPAPRTEVTNDDPLFQELQKKNLKLDEYLKDVYVRSYDKIPEDSPTRIPDPNRPLPQSREPVLKATFKEPQEVEEGWCTITDISKFIEKHGADPEKYSSAAIAKQYNLEQKKVENTLKYFTIFRVYDIKEDFLPRESEMEESMPYSQMRVGDKGKNILGFLEDSRKSSEGKEEKKYSQSEFDDKYEKEEKAVKNQ